MTRRLLLCTHGVLSKRLGAVKPMIELAEAMRPHGWEATVWGRDDLAPADLAPAAAAGPADAWYPAALRARLRREAADYDVVDYDQTDLPFPRAEFPADTLMVARSVLLVLHLLTTPIRTGPSARQRVGAVLKRRRRRADLERVAATAARTLAEADLVNVSNRHDRHALVAAGMDPGKVAVLPFGIGRDRMAAFDAVPVGVPAGPPTVAFVGTFDYRKGGREMPAVLARLAAAVPGVRLRLLGTAGMFATAADVLAHFPRRLRPRVEVVPRFDPADLPRLLADCWAGIFPSHLEGFPFGVLEMLAAALPVVAYDAPGPPEMLPADWLVPVVDADAMAARMAGWLSDPAALADARRAARGRAAPFTWDAIAGQTAGIYERHLAARRGGPSPTRGGVPSC